MPAAVTDTAFDAEVLKSDKPVLLDFWAEWCGPCKMISPILDELEGEVGNKISIRKMNIDENPMTPGNYGIRSIPTLLLLKDGQVVGTKVGAVSKGDLKSWIDTNV